MKNKDTKKLVSFISSDKARVIFVVVGLVAVVLIFISNFNTDNSDESEIPQSTLDVKAYSQELSTELVSMIESIEGTGRVKVLLTLNSSYEYVYLEDNKTLSKILEPEVRGVAVACDGGDNPVIKEKITVLLRTVLSVNADGISISKLK